MSKLLLRRFKMHCNIENQIQFVQPLLSCCCF
uniref:Uncharacterized protein n=1 Tax=Rhizophora mucronata TaxID=61149 RepID=A0A2P2NE32_RHIMU